MTTYPVKPRIDVAINYLASGEFCTNVACYTGPAEPPAAGPFQTFADLVDANFGVPLKLLLSQGNEYLGVEVRYISATAGRYTFSEASAGPGVGGSAPIGNDDFRLPSGDVVVIQKHGDGPPKRANGTIYVSGINEADHSNSRLLTNAMEAAQSYGNAFEDSLAVGGFQCEPCVHSRTADLLYKIIQTRVTPVLGHLRRRRPVR